MANQKEARVARVLVPTQDVLANTVGSQPFFLDGAPNRKAAGVPDVPPFMYNILSFTGPAVFAPGGSGFGRFAATLTPNVRSYGDNGGQLLFLRTHPNAIINLPGDAVRVPELTAVYLPPGIDLSQPISMHIFFSPNTGPKTGDYPYGFGAGSFSEMTDNYLVSGGKRLLNQCNASGKRFVFVFPLAPRETQFRGILPAPRMRRFLQEISAYLLRTIAGSFAPPQLGVCSASCFSAGAQTLVPLLTSSLDPSVFPEFKEAYFLDGFPGDGGAFANMTQQINAWWNNGAAGRCVRLYSHFNPYLQPALRPAFAQTPTSQGGGSAFATETPTATLAYTPQKFWELLVSELKDGGSYFTPPSPYAPNNADHDGQIHQLMPEFFLQHALVNSTHPSGGP